MVGLIGAFGSAMLFVTQNIVSKRLFNEAARAESEGLQQALSARKPDKLNLLCYSSALAFLFTLPIWLWSEAPGIIHDFLAKGAPQLSNRPDALDHGRLTLEFIFNGTFHFAQSLVAFVLLSMVSPVTYSVASLIKRVFVIVFAIVWFGNSMTTVQGVGILMTFTGLYLYDRTNDASRADRRVKLQQTRSDTPLLPLINEDKKVDLPARIPTPLDTGDGYGQSSNPVAFTVSPEEMKSTPSPFKNTRAGDGAGLLRPGTKQETTWRNTLPPQPNGTAA
ncbi:MAG: suppressor of loss of ypt1 [Alyxoria varia]|nr:MAG: suppressor of loss of ypt1 [Alyxoria varia]